MISYIRVNVPDVCSLPPSQAPSSNTIVDAVDLSASGFQYEQRDQSAARQVLVLRQLEGRHQLAGRVVRSGG